MPFTTHEQNVADANTAISDGLNEGGAERISTGSMNFERSFKNLLMVRDAEEVRAARATYGRRVALGVMRGVGR
jgi:hypothetical protein